MDLTSGFPGSNVISVLWNSNINAHTVGTAYILLFATWRTAACKQRINANGFNAIWFILLKQKHDIKNDSAIIITLITWSSYLVKKTAHSVRADPSSSCLTCPVFHVLAHVAPALAEHWLLIFPTSWGAGPSLAPLPQADPISLRSQATACSHVRHNYYSRCMFYI